MKASYLITLSCFMYKMKLNKRYSEVKNGCPKMQCDSLVNFTWIIMIKTTSYANSSNSSIVKLVRVLNTSHVVHMVAKTSCTPILRLINCMFLPPTMLIWSIPKYWHKWLQLASQSKSFATIFSNNSLSLLGEFKLKLDKITCIGGKWNGISKRKMKWDSQKP